MSELVDQSSEEPAGSLYTVVAGEGDGFMLALAAGDTAGGAWELGYSAVTEQATIIAYELIAHRRIQQDRLVTAILELDGVNSEEPVYRAESPEFRRWLDRARVGDGPLPDEEPSLEAAVRATVIGVAYRRDPQKLIEAAVELGGLFHTDTGTVVAGVLAASAVGASCFAQSGLDLVAGVAESVDGISEVLAPVSDESARFDNLNSDVMALIPSVGTTTAEDAVEVVGGDASDPVQAVLAGILLAAPVAHRHHLPIEQAARIGGSALGAVVGAIVGARVGIRAWPWAFANDTWFAEIGRRLVRGPDEVRDLPIPYAVEQHLISGGRHRFH